MIVAQEQFTRNNIMDEKTKRLHEIMKANKMKAHDVGALLGREPNTVRIWRSKDPRSIPDDALKLLELAVAAKGA